MKTIVRPLAGLRHMLAFYRLYRWWNTSPSHKHVGGHRRSRG